MKDMPSILLATENKCAAFYDRRIRNEKRGIKNEQETYRINDFRWLWTE